MALKLVPSTADQQAAYDGAGSADGAGGGRFRADGRRVIQHDPGRLPEVLDEMGEALKEFCAGGGNLFRWGSGLARVYVTDEAVNGPVKRWA
ncbi:MAG TPA: hypothetical protein P5038_21450, partial [Candidatus Paceibacterota bacterium]|nr:hypothetical protein [Candidatus Paceibacterota bacterium]